MCDLEGDSDGERKSLIGGGGGELPENRSDRSTVFVAGGGGIGW
jgi:hypothetical protein